MMILVNALEKESVLPVSVYEALVRMLAPFAPHLTEELWERLGKTTSIHLTDWPLYSTEVLETATATIVVQVNGKVRGTFTAEPNATKEELLSSARAVASIQAYLSQGAIRKEVVVPGRLVSFVVE
jgi:leucyl-tRNA synthetase